MEDIPVPSQRKEASRSTQPAYTSEVGALPILGSSPPDWLGKEAMILSLGVLQVQGGVLDPASGSVRFLGPFGISEMKRANCSGPSLPIAKTMDYSHPSHG
jgi:hypothetical protein